MDMKIEMLNLPRLQKEIEKPLKQALEEIYESAKYIGGLGESVFEKKLTKYCQRPYAVGVGSCTDALYIGLRALGIKPGDEVITVANSFYATTEAIMRCNAVPVMADVEESTLLMDINKLPALITEKTKFIMPVHLYGNVVDVEKIEKLLEEMGRTDIQVLEDCAHAFGSRLRNKPTPIGKCGAFSFNPGKNCGAFSDAGAVICEEEKVSKTVRLIKDHGRESKNVHVDIGMNSRLSALNDKVLSVKIEYIEQWNQRRRDIAQRYINRFQNIPEIKLLKKAEDVTHSYHQFVIRVNDRESLRNYLKENGVSTGLHYPDIITNQSGFKNYVKGKEYCIPVTQKANKEILSLPCYAQLTDEEVEYIISLVEKYFRK